MPIAAVVLVAGALVGQILIASKENLYPLLRAWLLRGSFAAFVYPLDFAKTSVYDIPTGYSYAAALFGCLVAGLRSAAEGRYFWSGKRDVADPIKKEVE